MIITEILGELIHHYSDKGYKIRQIETGINYDDAIDIIPCPYTYEETDEFVDSDIITSEEDFDIF